MYLEYTTKHFCAFSRFKLSTFEDYELMLYILFSVYPGSRKGLKASRLWLLYALS